VATEDGAIDLGAQRTVVKYRILLHRAVSKAPIGNWGSALMTAGGGNVILEAMAATLPSATCTPTLRGAGCHGFAVASGDLHPLQVVRAEPAGKSIGIRDDRTAP
jgi:hypothetical protein